MAEHNDTDKVVSLQEARDAKKTNELERKILMLPPLEPDLELSGKTLYYATSVRGDEDVNNHHLRIVVYTVDSKGVAVPVGGFGATRKQWEEFKAVGDRILDACARKVKMDLEFSS